LGEQDENGIDRLNIDFIICIKFMAKFGQNDDKVSFPRNSSNGVLFLGMIEDMM
jgi:hypothetical protein